VKETRKRILERLPSFYKAWTDKSLLSKFVESFAETLSEAEKDLFRILRGHWIDSAKGVDLDKLASVNNIHRQREENDLVFRRRVKRAIQEYKGGGTRAALEFALRGLFGSLAQSIELIEFPPTPISFSIDVTSGDTWRAASLGIEDSYPTITMSVETKGAEVRDPQVTSLSEGVTIGIAGLLSSGQELVLTERTAMLSGTDVKSQVKGDRLPSVLRKGSEWQYREFLHGKLGVFDTGTFDESFFATPLPKVRIRFDWISLKTSTVEVRIPKPILDKTGFRENEIASTLNSIKAAGVELLVKTVSPSETLPMKAPAVFVPESAVQPVKREAPVATEVP